MIYLRKYLLFLIKTTPHKCLLIFLICNNTYAQTNQSSINQQDRIIRNQQDIQETQRRQREFEAIKKERERLSKEQQDIKDSELKDEKNKNCFKINKIEIRGANLLSNKKKITLTKDFISQCFDSTTISKVSSVINNYYISKGYSTTQVSIPKQNIASETLLIDVIEGKISNLILNDDGLDDRMQKFMAFGNLEEKTLNINEINQGIYQINRISFNNAKLKIKPAKKVGYSDVVVENKSTFPATFGVGYNNTGTEFTGVRLAGVTGIIANLLSLNDETTIGVIGNVDDDSKEKDLKSFYSTISIPFKYYTFSYNYSRTEFKGTELGTSTPLILTGYSDENKFSLERILKSDTQNRITTTASLSAKKTASYLNQQKIETSERKLSILNLSISATRYFKNGATLYLKPSYSRGLKILNAKQDPSGIAAETPSAQFQSYKLYTSLSKRFTIPKTNIPFSFTSEFNGQISKNTLFGSEQISVGGYYSVRGYRENFITGDHGFYSRNSLSFDVKDLLPNLTSKPSFLLEKSYQYLNRISIKPFYDYGMVRSKFGSSNGRMSGTGMEIIMNRHENSFFEASLTLSKGLNRSKLTTTNRREDYLIYFDIKAKIF